MILLSFLFLQTLIFVNLLLLTKKSNSRFQPAGIFKHGVFMLQALYQQSHMLLVLDIIFIELLI